MKRRAVYGDRPPAYPSKDELAAELCISVSTLDSYVARDILPKPIRRGSLIRWCWAEVEAHLAQRPEEQANPFQEALKNVS